MGFLETVIIPTALGTSLLTPKESAGKVSIILGAAGVAAGVIGYFYGKKGEHEKALTADVASIVLDSISILKALSG